MTNQVLSDKQIKFIDDANQEIRTLKQKFPNLRNEEKTLCAMQLVQWIQDLNDVVTEDKKMDYTEYAIEVYENWDDYLYKLRSYYDMVSMEKIMKLLFPTPEVTKQKLKSRGDYVHFYETYFNIYSKMISSKKEDPWTRLEIAKKLLPYTQTKFSKTIEGYENYERDVKGMISMAEFDIQNEEQFPGMKQMVKRSRRQAGDERFEFKSI